MSDFPKCFQKTWLLCCVCCGEVKTFLSYPLQMPGNPPFLEIASPVRPLKRLASGTSPPPFLF